MTKLEEKKVKRQVIEELEKMFKNEKIFHEWIESSSDLRLYEFILNRYKDLHRLYERGDRE